MSFEISRFIAGLCLLCTSISIGSLLLCGLLESSIFNLDAIFRMNTHTETLITKYDQGIIMSAIFNQLYYILLISAIFIFIYETLSFRFRKSSFFVWILNIINVILMLLFCFFYLPGIARIFGNEPKIAATPESESFLNQTSLVLQILCVTLLIAFFIRLSLINTKRAPL
ncbi:DUF4149 domain-containing protein [Helicobacter sp. MIT 14-3879]|uniref:DUF4149 domain-containing protein n=1 Tax=Helicobacter sp. MIT 14-3879 TaxID=2040649 RepID=UPI000E1E7762|nr:DUF4149 domain-containing protein [Helicobacter sp. MIT 14-3879]RDU60616.1 hypothetical protein CQA44_10345 [Helicobacter sp. MIT 14-3879]